MQIFNELITHTGVLWGENDKDEFAFNVPNGYEYESFDLDVLNGTARATTVPYKGETGRIVFRVAWKYAFFEGEARFRLRVEAEEIPGDTPTSPPDPDLPVPIVLEPPYDVLPGNQHTNGLLTSSAGAVFGLGVAEVLQLNFIDLVGERRIKVVAEIEVNFAQCSGSVTLGGGSVESYVEMSLINSTTDENCEVRRTVVEASLDWGLLTQNILVPPPEYPTSITLECAIDVDTPIPNAEYEIWIGAWSYLQLTNWYTRSSLNTSQRLLVKQISIRPREW